MDRSLSHSCLPQDGYHENPHFSLEEALPRRVVECYFDGFETVPVESTVKEIVSLANTMGLDVDNNDIDELVKEYSQELTTEKLMELHCFSQQEVVEEEEVAKKQSSGAIREKLKACKTVASYIEKHHSNNEVAVRFTNLFNDNAVIFSPNFEASAKTNVC